MQTNRRADCKLSATPRPLPEEGCRAFTLTELLVVLFTVGILALFLRPAWAGSQQEAKAFQCLSNMRQMALAWILYAQDNHDALADNGQDGNSATPNWCAGIMDWTTSSQNTNTAYLTNPRFSLLGQYLANDARLFSCPADGYASPVQRALGWPHRCRSVAMDGSIGGGPKYMFNWPMIAMTNMRNFTILRPAMSWVLIDEHPDSIDDSIFYLNPAQTNGVGVFTELPAGYHNNAGGVNFADGHAEIHRWVDARILLPVRYAVQAQSLILAPFSPDLAWLAQHTPY